MQTTRRFLGILAGSLLSCAGAAPAHASPSVEPPRSGSLDRHSLALAALDCVMAPIVYDTPPWAASDPEMASLGPETTSCTVAGRAIGVRAARLYRLSPDVLFDLRHAIAKSSAGAEQGEATASDVLTLFDRSIAAVLEARHARAALVLEAPHPSTEAVDKIRARDKVIELDDLGRRGGVTGVEARAVAMLIAANAFLQITRVKPEVRPYVAEPLFTMMFGSEFLSTSPDEAASSWTDYLAAAARAAPHPASVRVAGHVDESTRGASRAVGGGPRERELVDAAVVTQAVANEMSSLAAELGPGALRTAVQRTIDRLMTFEIDGDANAR